MPNLCKQYVQMGLHVKVEAARTTQCEESALMSRGYVLAIDQGTTGTKVILFDRAGEIAAQAYAEITQFFPQPGWVEHDPVEIVESARILVSEALARAQTTIGEIQAIGVTNQRETVVLWDRLTGEPVAP